MKAITRLILDDGNYVDTDTPLVEIGASGARWQTLRDKSIGWRLVTVNLDHMVLAHELEGSDDE